jgi:phosphatidylglycerophosphate synthase
VSDSQHLRGSAFICGFDLLRIEVRIRSMLDRWGPRTANLLTATRVVLTPLFMLTVCFADRSLLLGVTAVGIFAVAAATDVLDGPVARRWRSDSNAGRVFDHFADVGFLVPALSTYVGLGLAPWWVPAAIVGSFGFYIIDSRRRTTTVVPSRLSDFAARSDQRERTIEMTPGAAPPAAGPPAAGPTLIGSRIGHLGGVCNYVLVGVLVCNDSARIHWLSPAFLSLLFWLVPLYSGGAVLARLLARRAALPVVRLAATRE